MSGAWSRRRAERQTSIVAAAMEIVISDGLDALTMPRLAETLGVAVGGLYRYFPSKDKLLLALQREAIEAFGTFLDQRLEEADDDVARRLRALPRAFVGFSEADPARFRLIEAFIADPRVLFGEGIHDEAQANLEPVLTKCRAVFEEAAAAGLLAPGDPMARVYLMWGSLQGVMLFRKRDLRVSDHLRVATLVSMLEETLIRGWSAR